jgi:hypothetical protein
MRMRASHFAVLFAAAVTAVAIAVAPTAAANTSLPNCGGVGGSSAVGCVLPGNVEIGSNAVATGPAPDVTYPYPDYDDGFSNERVNGSGGSSGGGGHSGGGGGHR